MMTEIVKTTPIHPFLGLLAGCRMHSYPNQVGHNDWNLHLVAPHELSSSMIFSVYKCADFGKVPAIAVPREFSGAFEAVNWSQAQFHKVENSSSSATRYFSLATDDLRSNRDCNVPMPCTIDFVMRHGTESDCYVFDDLIEVVAEGEYKSIALCSYSYIRQSLRSVEITIEDRLAQLPIQ